jgi:hypothetical protein
VRRALSESMQSTTQLATCLNSGFCDKVHWTNVAPVVRIENFPVPYLDTARKHRIFAGLKFKCARPSVCLSYVGSDSMILIT